MRQVAVHQAYDCEAKTSTWTFIQCPPPLLKEIVDFVVRNGSSSLEGGQLTPLDFVLTGTSQKWGDYVNDLESEIGALVSLSNSSPRQTLIH
jgi:hypothetical protein